MMQTPAVKEVGDLLGMLSTSAHIIHYTSCHHIRLHSALFCCNKYSQKLSSCITHPHQSLLITLKLLLGFNMTPTNVGSLPFNKSSSLVSLVSLLLLTLLYPPPTTPFPPFL